MKIGIFGASGGTGLLLTERCLAAGYIVTALVRTPSTFLYADRVEVVQGDATVDAAAVGRTVAGADVVLSALGARSLGKEDVLERAMPLIVAAMQRHGVKRLVTLGSSGTLPDALEQQSAVERFLVERLIYRTLLKNAVASQRAQWAVISGSELDWVFVMPPRLLNEAGRGVYRVDGQHLPKNGFRIARADVAEFMMRQVESREWVGRPVYVAW